MRMHPSNFCPCGLIKDCNQSVKLVSVFKPMYELFHNHQGACMLINMVHTGGDIVIYANDIHL